MKRMLAVATMATALGVGAALMPAPPASVAHAQVEGNVPGESLGNRSDPDLWRDIRRGERGYVSLPDKRAGVLIQSEGDNWRALRNGPISTWGGWSFAAVLAVLALFFAARGRIRTDGPPTGRRIRRFTLVERTAHWLTAVSFIILALTGLNILYGRYFLPDLIGRDAFAAITQIGKYTHHYVAFAFMVGLAMLIVLWLRHNLPERGDWTWLKKGGGMFTRGVHPPAGKFNPGQKMVFWLVVLGGVVVSLTGLNLMFPFIAADMLGMQLSQVAHAVTALALTVLIIAHIYIGSLGMEGAFESMRSGMVDETWAREHHSRWAAQMLGEGSTVHHQGKEHVPAAE